MVAIAIIVPAIITVLLVLLFRAYRTHRQRGIANVNPAASSRGSASATLSGGGGGILQGADHVATPPVTPYLDAAPTYYSASPTSPMNPIAAPSTSRLPEMARYAPMHLLSLPGGRRWAGDMARRSTRNVASDIVGVRGYGNSISGETAPPMYQSEADVP